MYYYDQQFRRQWCRDQIAARRQDYQRSQPQRPSAMQAAIVRIARSVWSQRRRAFARWAPAARA